MFYGTTTLATDFTEELMSHWKVRFLEKVLFFVPRANTDIEKMYPQVKKWALEVSEEGWPQREVGLDAEGRALFRTPEGRNTGFWTDMSSKQFTRSELAEMSAHEFEQLWVSGRAA